MKAVLLPQTACIVLFLMSLLTVSVSYGRQLDVRHSSSEDENTAQSTDLDDDWNSHIDNQTYLRDFHRRQGAVRQTPVIIVDREGRDRCRSRSCGSWGVNYSTNGSSFTYYENYRPNRYHPIYIYSGPRRGHPTPYISRGRTRECGQRMESPDAAGKVGLPTGCGYDSVIGTGGE